MFGGNNCGSFRKVFLAPDLQPKITKSAEEKYNTPGPDTLPKNNPFPVEG
jgi:hypothetical protein